jgi:hypothetical protein
MKLETKRQLKKEKKNESIGLTRRIRDSGHKTETT